MVTNSLESRHFHVALRSLEGGRSVVHVDIQSAGSQKDALLIINEQVERQKVAFCCPEKIHQPTEAARSHTF